jgi:ATP-dependent Lon protease
MTDKPKRKKKPAPEPAPRPEELVLPDVLPVIPSGTNVVYPQQLMPIMAVEERDKRAIDEVASSEGKLVAIFSEPDDDEGSKGGLRLRDVGTVAAIVRMAKAPDGSVHAILQGRARIRLVAVEDEGPPVRARVERLDDEGGADLKAEAVMREASEAFVRAANLSDTMPAEIAAAVSDIREPAALADFIAANLPLKPVDRYQVLAELNVGRRLTLVNSLLNHELEVLEVRSKIQSDV